MTEEEECRDDKVLVYETTININDTNFMGYSKNDKIQQYEMFTIDEHIKKELSSSEVSDNNITDIVKIEDQMGIYNIKIEFNNGLLFCDCCHTYYEDYCTMCGMLVQILNKNGPNATDNRACDEIPSGILKIENSIELVGIFARRIIPEGVQFGPFNGLLECSHKLKRGKFIAKEGTSKYLNWMQHVNPARSISEQNLVPFQCEDNLYYRSTRQIESGEELLVYFGEEYEDSLNEDIEMDFIPAAGRVAKDVFACIFCCLGFNSGPHLTKHKSVCLREANEKFSIEELTQCPFCSIYLWEKEYAEYHMDYCCGVNVRKCISPGQNMEIAEAKKRKTRPHHTHKCTRCKFTTKYRGDLVSHTNEHHGVKTRRCGFGYGRYKTKGPFKFHTEKRHVGDGGEKPENSTSDNLKTRANKSKPSKDRLRTQTNQFKRSKTKRAKEFHYKCTTRKSESNQKVNLKEHIETRHLKEFAYKCEICHVYRSSRKIHLERHIRTRHPKEFKHVCDTCHYETNEKSNLERHIKTKHLKEFDYKCEMCQYRSSQKTHLESHIKAKHLKEFDYKCEMCQYRSSQKTHLERHIKAKHLKEFDYNCEICQYRSNEKGAIKSHVIRKHLTFNHECDMCEYRANRRANLVVHLKTVHLKEFIFECAQCKFRTDHKPHLLNHVRTIHLKEFKYKCASCDYQTNRKCRFEDHARRKHQRECGGDGRPKEFSFACVSCDFKTNYKWHLNVHLKSKHLGDFRYECEVCEHKTNRKDLHDSHVKSKHLNDFRYECEVCGYKTNHKTTFEMHRKTKHLRMFRYKCVACNYETNNKRDLIIHVKSKHLKEFDYKCGACAFRTSRKSSLKSHVKKKHPEM